MLKHAKQEALYHPIRTFDHAIRFRQLTLFNALSQ